MRAEDKTVREVVEHIARRLDVFTTVLLVYLAFEVAVSVVRLVTP